MPIYWDGWEMVTELPVDTSLETQAEGQCCNHCLAPDRVKVTTRGYLSEQWTCFACLGKTDVEVVQVFECGSRQITVRSGDHGPYRDYNREGRGCCLPVR